MEQEARICESCGEFLPDSPVNHCPHCGVKLASHLLSGESSAEDAPDSSSSAKASAIPSMDLIYDGDETIFDTVRQVTALPVEEGTSTMALSAEDLAEGLDLSTQSKSKTGASQTQTPPPENTTMALSADDFLEELEEYEASAKSEKEDKPAEQVDATNATMSLAASDMTNSLPALSRESLVERALDLVESDSTTSLTKEQLEQNLKEISQLAPKQSALDNETIETSLPHPRLEADLFADNQDGPAATETMLPPVATLVLTDVKAKAEVEEEAVIEAKPKAPPPPPPGKGLLAHITEASTETSQDASPDDDDGYELPAPPDLEFALPWEDPPDHPAPVAAIFAVETAETTPATLTFQHDSAPVESTSQGEAAAPPPDNTTAVVLLMLGGVLFLLGAAFFFLK